MANTGGGGVVFVALGHLTFWRYLVPRNLERPYIRLLIKVFPGWPYLVNAYLIT